ncbi:MAG: hypothetical protein ACI8P0_005079 [Planctomycetaceae bacterium]|jgi:hypothetical protein
MSTGSCHHLTSILRRRSPFVSGLVLLCLVGQVLLPAMDCSFEMQSTSDASDTGCCVSDLTGGANSKCCCSVGSRQSCGCVCGTKKSSDSPRTIKYESCGCGGKDGVGVLVNGERAILAATDEPLTISTNPGMPSLFSKPQTPSLIPPTPPPELCV